MYTVMVERGAIYFDVKVSFVESCENTKEDKKKNGKEKKICKIGENADH